MILVTGATGQIGGELVRLLTDGGVRPRVLTRDPARAAHLGDRVEVARGDLLDVSTVAPALAGIDQLFLVGEAMQIPGIARAVAPVAARAGVRRIVLVSSGTIDIRPPATPSRIGAWHREAELAIEATGLGWTFLRPGNFASNALRWAGTIKSQGAVFAPAATGRGRSAVIDPRDIAAVAHAALTQPGHDGQRHLIMGPSLMTLAEQVDVLARVLAKPIRLVDVPEAGARQGMLKSGMPEVLVDAVLELQRDAAEGRSELLTPTVKQVTGREPRSFEEWARDHAAAFR